MYAGSRTLEYFLPNDTVSSGIWASKRKSKQATATLDDCLDGRDSLWNACASCNTPERLIQRSFLKRNIDWRRTAGESCYLCTAVTGEPARKETRPEEKRREEKRRRRREKGRGKRKRGCRTNVLAHIPPAEPPSCCQPGIDPTTTFLWSTKKASLSVLPVSFRPQTSFPPRSIELYYF